MPLCSLDGSPVDSPRGRVIRWVTDQVGQGRLRVGEPLPSERVLADELGVSRAAVRAALDEMLDSGAIEQSPGGRRHRRIASPASRPESGLLADTVMLLSSKRLPKAYFPALPGQEEVFVQYEAARRLALHDIHALTVSPQRLVARGLAHLTAHPPAGVLVAGEVAPDSPTHQVIRACHPPLPVVATDWVPDFERYDRVISNHVRGSADITRWLIERGARRIAFLRIEPNAAHWLADRQRGYEQAMREAGLEPSEPIRVPNVIGGDSRRNRHEESTVRLIAGYLTDRLLPTRQLDAIVAMSDGHAAEIGRACRLLGAEPGREILIAGYDNVWRHCVHADDPSLRPAITVEKHRQRVATEMVELLRERMTGKLPQEPQYRVVPHELVVPADGGNTTKQTN